MNLSRRIVCSAQKDGRKAIKGGGKEKNCEREGEAENVTRLARECGQRRRFETHTHTPSTGKAIVGRPDSTLFHMYVVGSGSHHY